MNFQNPTVLGAGSWGTALAVILAKKAPHAHLVARDPDLVQEINTKHQNIRYLPGAPLPETLIATTEIEITQSADLILFVVPTSATREMASSLAELNIPTDTILCSCSKGIERDTGKRMSEIIADHFPDNPIAILSGPNHAEEITHGLPAAATIGCADQKLAARLQEALSTDRFRTYTNSDLAGIELGGAIKNVYAIAAGTARGLQLGDNAIAALVTRALAELTRLGTALGGKPETFQGLSGLGDLIVTCFSHHSRNHRTGLGIAEGKTIEQIKSDLGMVAEGIPNTQSIYEAARRVDVRTPILDTVYSVLYQDVPPDEALNNLFNRSLRPETD